MKKMNKVGVSCLKVFFRKVGPFRNMAAGDTRPACMATVKPDSGTAHLPAWRVGRSRPTWRAIPALHYFKAARPFPER